MKAAEREVLQTLSDLGYRFVIKIDGVMYSITEEDKLPFKVMFEDMPDYSITDLEEIKKYSLDDISELFDEVENE